MTNLLLTGAGFSYNWGGQLASEAFEYLLGCPELDEITRARLWSDKNDRRGFEDTLAALQAAASTSAQDAKRVEVLVGAIAGMFNLMDQGFQARREFEFQNDMRYQVAPFLARFDAIFTLNQDLLLERYYFNEGQQLIRPQQWSGGGSPGVGSPAPALVYDSRLQVSAKRSPLPEAELKLHPRFQPYFKLHGSSHWLDPNGGQMLIVGGAKSTAIGRHPLLKWYAGLFSEYLHRPGAKLMVIGYGFADEHINAVIQDACATTGLKLFILDPRGVDVLDHRPNLPLRERETALMAAAQPRTIGSSRRALSQIFGGDVVEFSKVMRFFD